MSYLLYNAMTYVLFYIFNVVYGRVHRVLYLCTVMCRVSEYSISFTLIVNTDYNCGRLILAFWERVRRKIISGNFGQYLKTSRIIGRFETKDGFKPSRRNSVLASSVSNGLIVTLEKIFTHSKSTNIWICISFIGCHCRFRSNVYFIIHFLRPIR